MTEVGLVLGAGGLVGHAYHAGHAARPGPRTAGTPATSAVVVGTSAGSGVGALLRAGLPPADFAARVLGEPLSAEGARVVANAPRPARSFDAGRRSGRWPRCPPRPRAWPGRCCSRGACGPATSWPWARRPGTQPTAMIGDRIRAVYQGHRALARGARCGCARSASTTAAASCSGATRSPSPTSAPRSRRRRPSRACSRPSRSTASATSTAAPTPRPTPTSSTGSDSTRSWSCRRCRCGAGLPLRTVDGVALVGAPAAPPRAARGAGRPASGCSSIEPGADDLDAMGLSLQAMDGTRMEAVTRQAERSAASLLAGEAPLG